MFHFYIHGMTMVPVAKTSQCINPLFCKGDVKETWRSAASGGAIMFQIVRRKSVLIIQLPPAFKR